MTLQYLRLKTDLNCDYRGTPRLGHLVITATFFGPGKTLIHYLIRKPRSSGYFVNTANSHIVKSQPVNLFIILPRLYGHSNQLCPSFLS